MRVAIYVIIGLGAVLLAFTTVRTQEPALLFWDPLDGHSEAEWRTAPTTFVDLPTGLQALRFERENNWNPAEQPWAGDETWTSYRVEVDVLPGNFWAGVDFHVQNDGRSACNVTLLPLPDGRLVFEMAGLWGEAGTFKLWPVGQRLIPYRPGDWIHFRLDIGMEVINVYAGDQQMPVATFYDLPFSNGGVRLMTYASSALFRNLRITALPPATVHPILEDPWRDVRPGKDLLHWKIAGPKPNGYGQGHFPTDMMADQEQWKEAPTDGRGVVNLTALYGPDTVSGVAFGRTSFHSNQTGSRKIKVTYTDNFTLWINGTKVFEGPPRQWYHPEREKYGNSRLIPDQFEIEAPVQTGENEIVVRSEATERFGWAFWARLCE